MTNLHFTAEFMAILNDLLEAGITSCNVHETRLQLDYLFDSFEECEGVLDEIADADQQQEAKITMINVCLHQIETMDKYVPKELKPYFHTINNLNEDSYILFLDESEGNFIDESEVDCDVF